MTVDFELTRVPGYRVAAITHVGPWQHDHLRAEFKELVAWAKSQRLRTGKWLFVERGPKRSDACLEIIGRAKGDGRVTLKQLPGTRVARVVFDPDVVSPRVVYHGLNDFTRWRKKDSDIRAVGSSREVYDGDPWTNAKAWSKAQVQFIVR